MALDIQSAIQINESQVQARYFIGSATINGAELESDDYIIAKNDRRFIGLAQWQGTYADLVVMGDDGTQLTDGYAQPGSEIELWIFDASEEQVYKTSLDEALSFTPDVVTPIGTIEALQHGIVDRGCIETISDFEDWGHSSMYCFEDWWLVNGPDQPYDEVICTASQFYFLDGTPAPTSDCQSWVQLIPGGFVGETFMSSVLAYFMNASFDLIFPVQGVEIYFYKENLAGNYNLILNDNIVNVLDLADLHGQVHHGFMIQVEMFDDRAGKIQVCSVTGGADLQVFGLGGYGLIMDDMCLSDCVPFEDLGFCGDGEIDPTSEECEVDGDCGWGEYCDNCECIAYCPYYGAKWHDLNGNGIWEGPGEVGLPDVTIALKDDVGDILVNAHTNEYGGYMFCQNPECVAWTPILPTNECYQTVIAADSYCCSTSWDNICYDAFDACAEGRGIPAELEQARIERNQALNYDPDNSEDRVNGVPTTIWEYLEGMTLTYPVEGMHVISPGVAGPYDFGNAGVFPLSACCNPWGGCENLTEFDCGMNGGVYHPGEFCADVDCTFIMPYYGACCMEGFCNFMDSWMCLEMGGIPQGEGTDCFPDACQDYNFWRSTYDGEMGGTGYEETWFEYPDGNWMMWWPNEFTLNSRKEIDLVFELMVPPGAPMPEIGLVATSPLWTDPATPPLEINEDVVGYIPLSEPVEGLNYYSHSLPFCPMWVGFAVRSDAWYQIQGSFEHICIEDDSPIINYVFEESEGVIEIHLPDRTTELVPVAGSMAINVHFSGQTEGDAFDDTLNGLDEVMVEVTELNLVSIDPTRDISLTIGLDPNGPPSYGMLEEQVNQYPGVLDLAPYGTGGSLAELTLNVQMLVSLRGMDLVAEYGIPLQALVNLTPAGPGTMLQLNSDQPVELFDISGNRINYQIGTDTGLIPVSESPAQACCMATGCVNFSPEVCVLFGGIPLGEGSVCGQGSCEPGPPGACCLPDDACMEINEIECIIQSGEFFPDVDCTMVDCSASTGACCMIDDYFGYNCSNNPQWLCPEEEATWMGPGTDCFLNSCLEWDFWMNTYSGEQGGNGVNLSWYDYPGTETSIMWWPQEFALDRTGEVTILIDRRDGHFEPGVDIYLAMSTPYYDSSPGAENLPPGAGSLVKTLFLIPEELDFGVHTITMSLPYCPNWVGLALDTSDEFEIQGTFEYTCLAEEGPTESYIFLGVGGVLELTTPDRETHLVPVEGSMTLQAYFNGQLEGGAFDNTYNGLDEIMVEVTELNLVSVDALRDISVTVGLVPGSVNGGMLEEQINQYEGLLDLLPFGIEGSLADMTLNIQMLIGLRGMDLVAENAIPMQAQVSLMPFGAGEFLQIIAPEPIELFDLNGNRPPFTIGEGGPLVPSPAGPDEACCTDDGCVDIHPVFCGPMGGESLGENSVCMPGICDPEPTGACCFSEVECGETTQLDCYESGGTYIADDVPCDPNPCAPPTGACCYGDGSCMVTEEAYCLSDLGTYQGDSIACEDVTCAVDCNDNSIPDDEEVEACEFDCDLDGDGIVTNLDTSLFQTCLGVLIADNPDCDFADFDGDGIVSAPDWAVCIDEYMDICDCNENGVPDDCDVTDGTSDDINGNGVPDECEPIWGACCYAGIECAETTGPDCIQNGGTFLGADLSCEPNPCGSAYGACCFGDGSCSMMDGQLDCTSENGLYQGPGTTCLEDSCMQDCNGNGIPDDIEVDCTMDVNGDGLISPADVLIVINCINAPEPGPECAGIDVNGDGDLSAIDVLMIINWINENGVGPCNSADDCNGNGVPDECDLACDDQWDVNGDGSINYLDGQFILDCIDGYYTWEECQQADYTENGTISGLDLQIFNNWLTANGPCGIVDDCNENGIPDACDIANETSQDSNLNGIPDECDTPETGACCFGDACAENMTEDACTIEGGTWLGAGVDCFPNPCTPLDFWKNTETGEQGGTGWTNGETGPWIDHGMWWPNEFDLERAKIITVDFWIYYDPDGFAPELGLSWAYPSWEDDLNPPTYSEHEHYVSWDGRNISAPGHYTFQFTVPYCPNWININVQRSVNFTIEGTIIHECVDWAIEVDPYDHYQAWMGLELPDGTTELINLLGSIVQEVVFEGDAEGIAMDENQDELDEVMTRNYEMEMMGYSPNIGLVQLSANPGNPSFSFLIEDFNETPGFLDIPPFGPAGSTGSMYRLFSALYNIGGVDLVTQSGAFTVDGTITHKPLNPGDILVEDSEYGRNLVDPITGMSSGIVLHRFHEQFNPLIEYDVFPDIHGEFQLYDPTGASEMIYLSGSSEEHVYFEGTEFGIALDHDGDLMDEVTAELVNLDLTGSSSLGPVGLRVRSDYRSIGQIEETSNANQDLLDLDPFVPGVGGAEAFFDVFFEIEIAGQNYHTEDPKRIAGNPHFKPHAPDQIYLNELCHELIDAAGFPTGFLLCYTAIYTPEPTGACCWPDGTCESITPQACEMDLGAFQGIGVTCDEADCPEPYCGDGFITPPEQCEVDNDCNPGAICVDCECIVPFVEHDMYEQSLLSIDILSPGGAAETIILTGPTYWDVFFEYLEGQAHDDDGDPKEDVAAQITDMDLLGTSSFGPVVIDLLPSHPIMGQIEELIDNTSGWLDVDPFAPGDADSFFDVFFEIELGANTLFLITPARLEGIISHKPADGCDFLIFEGQAQLVDAFGNPTGFLITRMVYQPQEESACCLPNGTCVETGYADCMAQNGFFSVDACCEEVECLAVGACCYPGGECGIAWREYCIEHGGVYQGDGTDCDPNPCELPTGACCFGDGTCSEMTEEDCLSDLGGYLGDDVSCDDVDCPALGACCYPIGECGIAWQSYCIEHGGIWQGVGSDCDPDPCIEPECGDGMITPPEECETNDDCPNNGVCINCECMGYIEIDMLPNSLIRLDLLMPDGEETIHVSGPSEWHVFFEGNEGDAMDNDQNGLDEVETELVAMDLAGTSPHGPVMVGINPQNPSTGEIEERVNNTQGILDLLPFGPGTADSFFDVWVEIEIGNNTLVTDGPLQLAGVLTWKPAGDCDVLEIEEQIELIDPLTGEGTGIYILRITYVPDGTSACCLPDGSCMDTYYADCMNASGIYHAGECCEDISCGPPEGACCFDDGSCTFTTEQFCLGDGGTYQGDNVTCDEADCQEPTGACCFMDQCGISTQVSCVQFGGIYQGDGVGCDPDPCSVTTGACCWPGGYCSEVEQEICESDAGIYQGDDVSCDEVNCQGPECGNGILEEGEDCDDGNNIPHDGCNLNCEYDGDANNDGALNVTDIVIIVGNILNGQYNPLGDVNGDGFTNVIDIVMIVEWILGGPIGRGSPVRAAELINDNGVIRINTDGTVAGIQMEISGNSRITRAMIPEGWQLHQSDRVILLISLDGSPLTDDVLFTYEGNLVVESTLIADWHGNGIASEIIAVPDGYKLHEAYPNPFNPVTSISYSLPEQAIVRVTVFDMLGKEVTRLAEGQQAGGTYSVLWDAAGEPSGVYFVTLEANGFKATQKIMLIR